MDDLIVGLDIGTTKICAVIGDVQDDRTINVIGVGHAPSGDGVRRGIIVDIDKTYQAIIDAVDEAEKVADVVIKQVFVGIAGSHIGSINSQGIVAIKNSSREITDDDIDRAVENAKTAVAIPNHQEIIQILPGGFAVDEQREIENPRGMVGSRLEAQVHIVHGAVTAMQNILKCCEKADLKVEDVILQPYASSMAVLTEDERKLGVVLIDIGGGTTDLIIFQNGHVVHSFSAPIGGQYVTNDIAVGLKTGTSAAEDLKIRFGVACVQKADEELKIEVPMAGGDKKQSVSQKNLAEIIEPRMEEIFNEMKEQIRKHISPDLLPAGVVLTGGTSMMKGCDELAGEILGLPTRVGSPIKVSGLREKVCSPVYATALGLLQYGSQNIRTEVVEAGILGGLADKVRGYLRQLFTE